MHLRRTVILLVLFVLLALSACGGADDDALTSSTTATTVSTTTTSTQSTTVAFGNPVDLGEGVVVGAHPDAPIAYVSAIDHETPEVGCEGGDVARLYAEPALGGARVLALALPRRSGTVVNGGDGGTVAIVEQCEGFLTTVTVAVPGADGTMSDATDIDTTAAEADAQLQPSTIGWAADGASLLALARDLTSDSAPVRAVRLGLDGSVETLREEQDLLAVAQLRDGRLVTATPAGVRIGDGTPTEVAVSSIAVSPDGDAVAVFGDTGVHVLADGELREITGGTATVGSWAPSGGAIAYLRLEGDDVSAELVQLDGTAVTIAGRAGFGAPLITADGTAVLFNTAVDSGQGFAEPRATSRPIMPG